MALNNNGMNSFVSCIIKMLHSFQMDDKQFEREKKNFVCIITIIYVL